MSKNVEKCRINAGRYTMKNIIIGTAGHVDHGKTLLIKALSGIDTDRLAEEKKRGITIELGFAHIPNDQGYNIGVIDVPGHEKFIKNMLAGIGGIDFVVFVVAADEGIMPQTREHFEILQALGIDDGIIAITKKDMVDEEWLALLTDEVKEYFKGSFLEGKPIIPVSAKTGENIAELKEAIIAKCDRENKRLSAKELFRLPVDRVFSMPGFGTVVTGTLIDGECSVGEDIVIYPTGLKAKIRGIQTYGKDTEKAIAGQRTAINLSGVKKEEIARGDVVAYEDAVTTTSMLDVSLKIFNSSDRTVLNNSRVHIYAGSKEALCKVILLDRDALSAGETCYAQLRLEEPMALKRGDRFIIRFYSPIITIGGGRILDVYPDKHKRNREDVLKGMEILDKGELADIICMKAGQRRFVRNVDLAHEIGILVSDMEKEELKLEKSGRIIKLEDGSLLSAEKFERLSKDIEYLINSYHDANPLSDGIPKQELLSRLKTNWHVEDERLLTALVKCLIDRSVISDNGKTISLAGFAVEYSKEQLALKKTIAGKYKQAGIELIKNDEIQALGNDRNAISALQLELAEEGVIRKVDASYFIDVDAWNKATAVAVKLGSDWTLAQFRDELGTSRKYAEILLASFDKVGYTFFNGKTRMSLISK